MAHCVQAVYISQLGGRCQWDRVADIADLHHCLGGAVGPHGRLKISCFLISSWGMSGKDGTEKKCLKCVVQEKADFTERHAGELGGQTSLMLQLVVETIAVLGSLRSGVLALLVLAFTQLARQLDIGPDNKQLWILNTLLLHSSWSHCQAQLLRHVQVGKGSQ